MAAPRILILGPPGAGKGTQAALLAQEYSIPHIATGDIFRSNVDQETELGTAARSYMDAGALVPDEIVIGMVADRLGQSDTGSGFVLDGFPRTTEQAKSLDQLLLDTGKELSAVVRLDVETEEVVARLDRRRETEGRRDDTAETVRARLREYAEKTAPLEDFYADRGLLVRVDGIGSEQEVHRRVLEATSAA